MDACRGPDLTGRPLPPFQLRWPRSRRELPRVCVPFADTLVHELPQTHASAIGWMVYLAIAPMAIGFLTWGYALARTTAGRMGATTYLVTPIAILLGWLLLGEVPPTLALVGGMLCLAGVYIAQRR